MILATLKSTEPNEAPSWQQFEGLCERLEEVGTSQTSMVSVFRYSRRKVEALLSQVRMRVVRDPRSLSSSPGRPR